MPEKVKKRKEKRGANDGAGDWQREARSGLTPRSRGRGEVIGDSRNQAAGGADGKDEGGNQEGFGSEKLCHWKRIGWKVKRKKAERD